MQNFAPNSQQFNERPIAKDQRPFAGGTYDDIPPSKIPSDAVKWLQNYIAFPDRLEPRGGSKKYTTYQLPVTGTVWGWGYQSQHKIIILQTGTSIYAAKYDFTADNDHTIVAGWNLVNKWYSANVMTGLTASPSEFVEYGDSMVIFNAGGIFVVDFSGTTAVPRLVTLYPINAAIPTQRLLGTITTKSDVNKYGYRYLYTMSRIRFTSDTVVGDRTTSGAVVELESGPVQTDATSFIDYGELWSPTKTGPSTASEKYPVWTGGVLPADFDTIAEFVALTNAQWKITVDSVAYNIAASLVGCNSFAEIAEVMQIASRGYSALASIEYAFNSSNRFVVTNPVKGGRITAFAAGDAGTSIHTVFSGGSETLTNWDTPLLLGAASGLLKAPIGVSNFYGHWTHFSIYRTLDIGEKGVDPITSQGNNKELYVWVGDFKIVNAFKCTTVTPGGDDTVRTLTATSAVFTVAEVGSTIAFRDGRHGTITGFTSSSVVTLLVAWGTGVQETAAVGVIGCSDDRIDLMSQAGTTVTRMDMNFQAAMVNSPIYWQDGSISLITAIPDVHTCTVAQSATKASQGAVVVSIVGDEDYRYVKDNISDDTLRTRIAYFTLKNRFWEPLANCDTGIISNGFLLGAIRGAKRVYYGQVIPEFSHLWGYHNTEKQIIDYKDPIAKINYSNDFAIVHCYGSHHAIPLNNYIEEKIEEIGEVVIVLTGTSVLSPDIGLIDYGSLIVLNSATMAMITNDNELQLLTYNGGSFQFSGDLSANRFSRRLKLNANYSAAAYDKVNGLIIWLKVTITADSDIYSEETLTKSYRIAILPNQGVGVSENTGAAWVVPPSQVGGLLIIDTNNQPHNLIIDGSDGYIYDIMSREGPAGASVARRWKDMIANDGTGGTNIACTALFGLDEGNRKRYYLQMKNSHVFLEPFDRSKANVSGYTSEGYPDSMEVDLTLFQDGSTATVKARAKDADLTGDVVFDRFVRAHGIQLQLDVSTAEHIITGRLQEYEAEDKHDDPDHDTTTEMEHQSALGNCDFWLFPRNGAVINRVTGAAPTTLPATTLVEDPTGDNLGLQINAGTLEDTNKTLSYSGDFSVKITMKDVNATGTYFYIGNAFSVRVYLDGATYKCSVLYNGTTTTVNLTWDGTGWCSVTVSRNGTILSIVEGV